MDLYNLVQIYNNKPVTSSSIIAEIFEKEHKNIIQSINNLKQSIFDEFYMLNFQQGKLIGNTPAYNLTRDGFTLLAMGFTGKKALEFKIKYIEAFNAMEEKLRGTPATPLLDAPQPGNNRLNYQGEASVEEFFRVNQKFYTKEHRYIFVYEEYSEWSRGQMLKPVKKDTFLYYLNKLNFFIYGDIKKYDSLLYL